MNNRQRMLAVLNYQPYDRLPIVHFGFWQETLRKWYEEGHLTKEEGTAWWWDGTDIDIALTKKLGFDLNVLSIFVPATFLRPGFESKVIEEMPDGTRKVLDGNGVIVLQNPNATGIPAEVDHLLKGRKEWEEHYKPKLQYSEERVLHATVRTDKGLIRYDQGGLEYLKQDREQYYSLHCGSLFGNIRNILGVVGSSYLYFEDEALFTEIIDTVGELCYRCVKRVLDDGAKFDFADYWEDICFKNGPLIIPSVFEEKVGPHYKRISDLTSAHGIGITFLDCDGMIDALIPTWLNNGVNTMFPIEVGTWDANIAPWREKYGRELRGIGGMNKVIFAHDRAAIDAEIERLKPLVDLGGFVPCPDHRLAPDAKWDLVQYYCEQMRKTFS